MHNLIVFRHHHCSHPDLEQPFSFYLEYSNSLLTLLPSLPLGICSLLPALWSEWSYENLPEQVTSLLRAFQWQPISLRTEANVCTGPEKAHPGRYLFFSPRNPTDPWPHTLILPLVYSVILSTYLLFFPNSGSLCLFSPLPRIFQVCTQ